MSDLISRQAAIDALRRLYIENPQIDNDFVYDMALDQADDAIKQLPSIQPEIVMCKDCRYYNSEEKECLDLMGHGRRWEEDDFCSYGAKMEVTE